MVDQPSYQGDLGLGTDAHIALADSVLVCHYAARPHGHKRPSVLRPDPTDQLNHWRCVAGRSRRPYTKKYMS